MRLTWEQLNAYVDGELDAAGCAEVAAALARDPDLAARVATLSRLRAATTEAAVSGAPQTPAPPDPAAAPGHGNKSRWALVAAGLVLAVGLGMGLARWQDDPARHAAGLDQAASMHLAWLTGAFPSPQPGRRQVRPAGAVLVPDLAEARLSFVYSASALDETGHPNVFLGYVGPNGCRLGLWVGRGADEQAADPKPTRVADVDAYVWSHGKRRYVLVAKGMDPQRLAALATIVAQIVERDHPPDDDMKLALRATTAGPACAA